MHQYKTDTGENASDQARTNSVQYHTIDYRISPMPRNDE
jgi:hypothetical protein